MHYEGRGSLPYRRRDPETEGRRPREGGPWRGAQEDLGRTTVPEGFNPPDRFGRMRPDFSNPFAGRINNNPVRPGYTSPGANIGGGWNLYEGGPEPRNSWEPYLLGGAGGGGGFEGDLDDTAYMEPQPFPFPGDPFPKPRPGGDPWGPFAGDTEGGEFDVAENSPEYLMWNSYRRKFGTSAANQWLMSQNVNRGGIMGLF